MSIEARIYWDNQDANNTGWAWATRVDGAHDSSGPLDDCSDDATDSDLIAALRSQALTAEASESLEDDSVQVIR